MGVLRYCYSYGGIDMKKGKVEFHSRGQSGNIYYIIGAVREVMKKQKYSLKKVCFSARFRWALLIFYGIVCLQNGTR